MKILLFSQMAGSVKHGMVFRNYALAKAWVSQGHEVTIVASSFSHSRTTQPETGGRVSEELIDGIRYIWVAGNKYKQAGTFGRVISMGLYTLQTYLMSLPLDKCYDVVIASSPTPFSIYPAAKYAKKFNAKLVYDIRDLWPLTLKEVGSVTGRHPFIKLMQRAEDYACKQADLVLAVPRNCENYLKQHGLADGRFLHIGNGAVEDSSVDNPSLPSNHLQLFDALAKKDAFIVGYAGAIGQANALHTLVDTLSIVPKNTHVVLMGHGALIDEIRLKAKELNVEDRLHFLPSVSRDMVVSFLDKVHIAYAGTKKKRLYEYGASLTKLNDYMLSAKPILYAVGDPGNPIELSGCGINCEAENQQQIAEGLKTLRRMPADELENMGKKGRNWCLENQMVSAQAKLILEVLEHTPPRSCQYG